MLGLLISLRLLLQNQLRSLNNSATGHKREIFWEVKLLLISSPIASEFLIVRTLKTPQEKKTADALALIFTSTAERQTVYRESRALSSFIKLCPAGLVGEKSVQQDKWTHDFRDPWK